MKPITYTLQFRGRASSVGADRMRFRLTAPSSALVTRLGPDGVHGALEEVAGGDAALEAELSLHEQSTFEDGGTIEFGHFFVHEQRSEAASAVRPLREGMKGEQP